MTLPERRLQGQSRWTRHKEGLFGICLAYHLKRERASLTRDRRYWHVDLNAGEGRNPLAGCKGTPFIFLDAVARHAVHSYRAIFVDKRRLAMDRLAQRSPTPLDLFAPEGERLYVVSDNARFLHSLEDRIRSTGERPLESVGSLLCDPNGIAQHGPRGGFPLEALGRLARCLPRWLVLIHWNYSAASRTAGYNRTHPEAPMSTLQLAAILRTVHRPYWLISQGFGGHSVLCGSAHWMPPHPAGLVILASPEGQECRRRQSGEVR